MRVRGSSRNDCAGTRFPISLPWRSGVTIATESMVPAATAACSSERVSTVARGTTVAGVGVKAAAPCWRGQWALK